MADEGPGFPEQLLPTVFERFTRHDVARTRSAFGSPSTGSGLGLAIVRAVLRSHSGDAAATNRPTGGAEVTLWWPDGGSGDTEIERG